MPHHASAKKHRRQTIQRTLVNRSRLSRIGTFIRKLNDAVAGGRKAEATEAFRQAESEIAKARKSALYHKKKVARKVSRLSARVKALND